MAARITAQESYQRATAFPFSILPLWSHVNLNQGTKGPLNIAAQQHVAHAAPEFIQQVPCIYLSDIPNKECESPVSYK